LLVVLYAFGYYFEPQGMRERHDHRHDVARVAGIAHAHHEAAVDLEDVDREARE